MMHKFMADMKATVWLIIATALSVYLWVSVFTTIIEEMKKTMEIGN